MKISEIEWFLWKIYFEVVFGGNMLKFYTNNLSWGRLGKANVKLYFCGKAVHAWRNRSPKIVHRTCKAGIRPILMYAIYECCMEDSNFVGFGSQKGEQLLKIGCAGFNIPLPLKRVTMIYFYEKSFTLPMLAQVPTLPQGSWNQITELRNTCSHENTITDHWNRSGSKDHV